jgi:hypothetical protein
MSVLNWPQKRERCRHNGHDNPEDKDLIFGAVSFLILGHV